MNRAERRQQARHLVQAPTTSKLVGEIEQRLRQERERTKQECINSSIRFIMSITLYILCHTFEFKKKDVQKFLTEFRKGFRYINSDTINLELEDVMEDVLKNTGVDCHEFS
jgi:hypothetical protein